MQILFIIFNYLIFTMQIYNKKSILYQNRRKKSDSIAGSCINCWVYDHSHTNIDTQICGTKIVCNLLGYVFQQEYLDNWLSHVMMIDI